MSVSLPHFIDGETESQTKVEQGQVCVHHRTICRQQPELSLSMGAEVDLQDKASSS